jgi:hypothetical protein
MEKTPDPSRCACARPSPGSPLPPAPGADAGQCHTPNSPALAMQAFREQRAVSHRRRPYAAVVASRPGPGGP